ncbi:MAG TPA: hypothetical protein VGH38_27875 [Bryobacteraceae bacterium]|jgi:hypothetical protein
MTPRPLSVTILAWVYIVTGTAGFIYHLKDTNHGLGSEFLWIEAVEVLAIVSGAFMLRGRNWARWLTLAWMGFHVVISAFDTFSKVAIHAVFLAVIAWLLFRPAAVRYFRRTDMTLI